MCQVYLSCSICHSCPPWHCHHTGELACSRTRRSSGQCGPRSRGSLCWRVCTWVWALQDTLPWTWDSDTTSAWELRTAYHCSYTWRSHSWSDQTSREHQPLVSPSHPPCSPGSTCRTVSCPPCSWDTASDTESWWWRWSGSTTPWSWSTWCWSEVGRVSTWSRSQEGDQRGSDDEAMISISLYRNIGMKQMNTDFYKPRQWWGCYPRPLKYFSIGCNAREAVLRFDAFMPESEWSSE